MTRIKSIGGCAQVRFASSPSLSGSLLFSGKPTLGVVVCSMLSSGGNQPRSLHSPLWTRDYRCTHSFLQTHSRWPTPPLHKIHPHIPMPWPSKRSSVVQISWPRASVRVPMRRFSPRSSFASGSLGRRTCGHVRARYNWRARSS